MQNSSRFFGIIGGLLGVFLTFLWFPFLVKILGLKEAIHSTSYQLMWMLGGWRYIIMDISILGLLLATLSIICIWISWRKQKSKNLQIVILATTAVIGLLPLFYIWLIPFILLGLGALFTKLERVALSKGCSLLGGITGLYLGIYWPIFLDKDQTNLFNHMFLLGGWKHFVFPMTVIEIGILALTFLCLFILLKEKEITLFHYSMIFGTGIIGLIFLTYLWILPFICFLLSFFFARKTQKADEIYYKRYH
ncbi:hypothetical protein [Thermoflavimicrobium daqui]|uniref:Uncharacterized protein n=1 Tax=Thermoflavimicrobium daqui TaxID=2137476 RepID=A0A364K8C4_9BACL|nr:hypothetical protein [Thermoflavimicrobium daqui]RAL26528.1 hypothetical protein DL897_00265 [Thermoflavimicrobium daqui]